MKTAIAIALACSALLLGACASRNSSEAEWQRAQCRQVIDSEARQKCMERADSEYGRR